MLGTAFRETNAAGGTETSVLLVEDDTHVAELYTIWLERAYDVTAVHTGDEAIDELDETFDVVLLDRQLPDWSGAKLLEELRLWGHDQPVVMITGTEPDIDIIDLSIDEYLVKPVSEDELLDAVTFATRLDSYDDALHEYYALISKRAVLESSNVTSGLRANDAYRELDERIAFLETQLELNRRAFGDDHYPQVFRRVLE